MQNTIRSIRVITTLLMASYLAACSMSADVGSIVDQNIDANSSRIELVSNGIATNDVSGAAVFRVYIVTSTGAAVGGFVPTLGVIGDGSNTASCAAVSGLYSECKVISDRAGEKIVSLENISAVKSAQALFTEPSSMVTITRLNDNAAANGTDSITFEFLIKNQSGVVQAGVHPHGRIVGTEKAIVNCTPSGSDGKAVCRFRSFEAGTFRLASAFLVATPYEMTFTAPKLVAATPRMDRDGAPTTIRVANPGPGAPVLESTPSDVTFDCDAPVGGYSECRVTSDSNTSVGTKVIRVTSPAGINEQIEVVVAEPYNSIVASPNNPATAPKADGSAPYEVIVDVKDASGNPIAGVVPVIDVIGSGDNQVTCQPSGADGKAVCQITSNTPGEKEIIVKSPATRETIKVTFQSASIVKDNPSPANGTSPIKIYVPMDSSIGEKPEITVTTSVSGAVSAVSCAPSIMNDDLGFAQSLCLVTANEPGNYTATITAPKAETLSLKFSDVKSTFRFATSTSNTASAGGGEVEVIVNLKNSLGLPRIGETPVLTARGSGTHVATCAASNSSGDALCTITNTTAGTKYISVSDPLIAGELAAQFTVSGAGFVADGSGSYPNVRTSVTDAQSYGVIYVNIGQTTSGLVPVLKLTGGGQLKSICEPSNGTGYARCLVQSDVVGDIEVALVEPSANTSAVTVAVSSNIESCSITNAAVAKRTWSGQATNDFTSWGACTVESCSTNYNISANACVAASRSCSPMPTGAAVGTQTWNSASDNTWGACTISSCSANYTISGAGAGNSCAANTVSCSSVSVALPTNATDGTTTWSGTAWGTCQATACSYPNKVASGACATGDNLPNLPLGFIDVTDQLMNTAITSNAITIAGIDIAVPISITGGISAYIETNRVPEAGYTNRGIDYPDLRSGDAVRIVSNSASTVTTATTVMVTVGAASAHPWTITTLSRTTPDTPVLTHVANEKSLKISWGANGAGNGNCKLQYQKDGSTWTDIAGFIGNCDATQAETTVALPGDGWTNNFASGVNVRIAMTSGGGIVHSFTNKLTCTPSSPLPQTDASASLDADCNGNWSDDLDNAAPTGGNFTIAAKDTATGGSSSATASNDITLNITCPTDQAGGVTYAVSETNSTPAGGSFGVCAATADFTLSAGTATKTVYMWFRDALGNTSASVSRSIVLDQAEPAGGSYTAPSFSSSLAVNLDIVCPAAEVGGTVAYGQDTVGAFEACPAGPNKSVTVNLTGVDGNKTLAVQFKDALGNATALDTKVVKLDRVAPAGGAVSIAEGANVNSRDVNLSITCPTDAAGNTPVMMAFGESAAPTNWATCAATQAFSIVGAGDGLKTIYVRFRDGSSNITSDLTATTTLDTGLPVGSFVIAEGALVGATGITLTVTCPGDVGAQMAYGLSAGPTNWTACASSQAMNLANVADGSQTVYMRFKDPAGNISASDVTQATTLDRTAPAGGGVTLATYVTTITDATVSLTCPTDAHGPIQVAYGNTTGPSNWESCAASKTLTLTAGADGSRTVYVKFRDAANIVTSEYTASTTLDTTVPSGGAFTITQGAYTATKDVTLNISACATDTNGPIEVAYGDTATPVNWETCSTGNKAYAIPDTEGAHTVYMRFRDAAGKVTTAVSNSTTLDKTVPAGGGVASGHTGNTGTAITVTVSASNDTGGSGMSAANGDYLLQVATTTLTGSTCGTYGAYADANVSETAAGTSYSYTGVAGNCYKFRYTVKDAVGNTKVYDEAAETKVYAPAVMTASPTSITGMNVTGPGSPAYGTEVTITYTNSGGVSATLKATALTWGSGGTNFEVTAGTTTCINNLVIAAGVTCVVKVRPKATANGALSDSIILNYDSAP